MVPSANTREVGSLNGVEKGEKKPGSPLKKSTNGAESPKKPPNQGWTCRDCTRLFTQREVYIAHMKREHGKVGVLLRPLCDGNTYKHYVNRWRGEKSQCYLLDVCLPPVTLCRDGGLAATEEASVSAV